MSNYSDMDEIGRLQQQSDGYKEHVLLLKEQVASLQAENSLLKKSISIESEVFSIGEPYREVVSAADEYLEMNREHGIEPYVSPTADWREIAAKAILGEPNPPYPVVPKRPRLTRNAAHCLTCDTIIESTHRHNWVACKCADNSDTEIYVDGGLSYSRRGAGVNAIYTDLCEYTK